jgi:hypothetical protein
MDMIRQTLLDTFRAIWVEGRLDYQRAADALEVALESAEEVRRTADARIDEGVRHADQQVEDARRRLSEIEGVLARQFDQFCGVTR